jgi:hypothetical protein
MATTKGNQFASKAGEILSGKRPSSMTELMDGQTRDSVSPENRKTVKPTIRKKREEFQIPETLAEMLRAYAYEHRKKKTAVVISALEEFFAHREFTVSEAEDA